MLHDIGKIYELSSLPENEYTDSGNLLGHIIMGTMMVRDKIKLIPGFSVALVTEIEHCILAHHGKLEYGSPKVPATVEAYALHLADNYDAKMESFKELFKNNEGDIMWLGFNKNLDTNVKKSIEI
jgi:3'-5' exoribonuclease